MAKEILKLNIDGKDAYVDTDFIDYNNQILTTLLTGILNRLTNIENSLYKISGSGQPTNCNQMLTNGCYMWGPDTANRPPSTYGTIFTTVSWGMTGNNANNWVNQLAFATDGKIYYRQIVNQGPWIGWKTII